MTVHVEDSTTQNWPFVTLPHFEVQGENTRLETHTEIFLFAPLLEEQSEKDAWASYSVENESWLQESYQRAIKTLGAGDLNYIDASEKHIPEVVFRIEGNWEFEQENSPGPWLPIWQISPPPPEPYPINFNMLSSPDMSQLVNYVREHQVPVMSDRLIRHPLFTHLVHDYESITPEHSHDDHGYDPKNDHATHNHDDDRRHRQLDHDPESNSYNATRVNEQGHIFVVYPVFDKIDEEEGRTLVGVFLSLVRIDWLLTDALHTGTQPLLAVLSNTCGENEYSYSVTGMDATFVGTGSLHDPRYEDKVIRSPLKHIQGVTEDGVACEFFLEAYPTLEFRESYTTDQAVVFTTILGLAFAMTALFFLFYVRIVQRRQTKVMATAARTNAIVTSLFPSNVRDRIMKDAEEAVANNKEMVPFLPGMGEAPKKKLKTFLDEENPGTENQLVMFQTKPIADLFPETTVMFADLVGKPKKKLLFCFWKLQTIIPHRALFFA